MNSRPLHLLLIFFCCLTMNLHAHSDEKYIVTFSRLIPIRDNNVSTYNIQTFIVNLDGSGFRPLTDIKAGIEKNPDWSPDASQIVLASNRGQFPINNWYSPSLAFFQLYLINLDSPLPQPVTRAPLPENGGSDLRFQTWSPDGQNIAFYGRFPEFESAEGIYLIKPDGTELRLLAAGIHPRWSPDGQFIVFVDFIQDINIVNVNTNEIKLLTTNTSLDLSPNWSPDGLQVVFMSDREGSRDIYRMNIDGTEVTRLTFDDENDEDFPFWSPNGKWIAYTTWLQSCISIIAPDGKLVSTLQLPLNEEYLQWLPDSSGLLFYRDFKYLENPQKSYSAIYMLDTKCLLNYEGCSEANLSLIPHTETPDIVGSFDISPIKLPAE